MIKVTAIEQCNGYCKAIYSDGSKLIVSNQNAQEFQQKYMARKPWVKPTITEFDFNDQDDIMSSTDG